MNEAAIVESQEKLKKLLKELFQFDVQDLDFGIYKIMNLKRKEIEKFIEKELIEAAETEFKEYARVGMIELQNEAEKLKTEINHDFGEGTIDKHGRVTKHEDAPKVKKYLEKMQELKTAEIAQGKVNDVFNHIYEFFSRYYDKGDFISKRRYGGKNKYSIPYDGEEVVLHWANWDQYYIKTGEYFKKYNFRVGDYRVNFLLKEVETELGNVKGETKYFILCEDGAFKLDEKKKELDVYFNYRALTEEEKKKHGAKNTQDKIVSSAVNKLLSELGEKGPSKELRKRMGEETVLEKHINRFVKRNTTDYFIHKNLKSFLERELDFYIKNEVLDIEEIERMDERNIKMEKAKMKVIKEISRKIIDFLAQIEDFQKTLWEKKKFVLRTDYCMTLDMVPEEFYTEIGKNEKQVTEWKELFKLDETIKTIKGKKILDKSFLKSHKHLVLDTKFFDQEFKDRLLASFDNLDGKIEGLLIKSENWQALNLLEKKYREKVKVIYIDPPYNTDASAILYKNDLKDSSWLTLIENRLRLAYSVLARNGIICIAIDDEEVLGLRFILSQIFMKQVGIAVVRSNPAGRKTKGRLAPAHEYALFFGKSEEQSIPGPLDKTEKSLARFPNEDEKGRFAWANFIRSGTHDLREDRPKLFYPIFVRKDNLIRIPRMDWNETTRQYVLHEKPRKDEEIVYPIGIKDGKEVNKNWQRGHERVSSELDEFRVRRATNGRVCIDFKTRMDEESLPITWWDNKEYASANYGAAEMKEIFNKKIFDFPKSRRLVEDCLLTSNLIGNSALVLDFFAGSGTTGHAVLNLNKKDSGNRKYILVELADYFDTVVKPRIQKVMFSKEWKDGKPVSTEGVSHMFKYLYLEQYEDTLNNIVFKELDKTVQQTLDGFRDYFLRYMLEYETRESPTRLAVEKFQTPFDYKIKTCSGNEEKEETVDLVETFNYLLGLDVEKLRVFKDGERGYRVVFGKRDKERIVVIWRNLKNLDLKKDKEFIEKIVLAAEKPNRIFINGDSNVKNAEAIEPEFKKLMGA